VTKRQCRRLEIFWLTKEAGDKRAYSAVGHAARKAVARSRSAYIKEQFDTVAGDSAATWKLTREVLHRDHRPQYSDH
jgi:hypothetical protein